MDQMPDIQAVVAGRSGLTPIIRTNHANKIFRQPFKSTLNYFYTVISIQRELSSCLYRASMTIKTLYYPTDAQIYNS